MTAIKSLKTYIENIVGLSSEEWQLIEQCTCQKVLNKNDILIREHGRFNQEVFVQEGVIRAYLLDNEGNERTTAFFRNNEFIGTNSLRTHDGLSLYNYQALCPTTLVLINSNKFASILNSNAKLIKLVKAVKEKENIRLSKRDDCLLQVKAADKYKVFTALYPNIDKEIAHHHIASYLGISPVSLSRIRQRTN